MFLELSEIFVCPACRPAQGLVVLVDAIEERRVREGHLGCPECEAKIPIRDGVLRFDLALDGTGPAASPRTERGEEDEARVAGPLAGVGRREAATRLAALLGADRAEGGLLLGPGLGGLADPLSRLADEAEVLALEVGPPERGAGTGVSRAVGIRPGALPVVTGRLAGVALLRPGPEEVREAVRVLREGGRAVLLEATPEGRRALEEEAVRLAAAGKGAVVAVREGGPAPARA